MQLVRILEFRNPDSNFAVMLNMINVHLNSQEFLCTESLCTSPKAEGTHSTYFYDFNDLGSRIRFNVHKGGRFILH